MAGDWIKIEHATARKAEVLKMARMLGCSRREVVGLLVDFFIWCDVNCVDGVVDGVVDADVDAVASQKNFSSVMVAVGWLKFHNEPARMEMINWAHHNGETAKKRALRNNRQAKWRSNVDASVDTPASTTASTREEKRRDIKQGSHLQPVDNSGNGAPKWWQSDASIQSKGQELGVEARPGESMTDYKNRIFVRLKG